MWGETGHSPGWEPPADRAAAAGLSLTGKWATISSHPQQSWHWGDWEFSTLASSMNGVWLFSSLWPSQAAYWSDFFSFSHSRSWESWGGPRSQRCLEPMTFCAHGSRPPPQKTSPYICGLTNEANTSWPPCDPSPSISIKNCPKGLQKMLLKHISNLLMVRPWLTNLQGNLAILSLKMLFTIDVSLPTIPNMSSDSVGLCC